MSRRVTCRGPTLGIIGETFAERYRARSLSPARSRRTLPHGSSLFLGLLTIAKSPQGPGYISGEIVNVFFIKMPAGGMDHLVNDHFEPLLAFKRTGYANLLANLRRRFAITANRHVRGEPEPPDLTEDFDSHEPSTDRNVRAPPSGLPDRGRTTYLVALSPIHLSIADWRSWHQRGVLQRLSPINLRSCPSSSDSG